MREMMTERVSKLYKRINLEPYWFLIALLIVAGAALFASHLQTGRTPSRAALHIPPLNFDIYWYGILIVGGIALGSFVVSRLAEERALRLFHSLVPAALQNQSITSLKLSPETHQALVRQKINTVGDLLLRWGFHPALLGLKRAGLKEVHDHLEELPGVEPAWLENAPWQIWNPAHVWNGVSWCLVLGVIGARLYHILTPSPSMAAAGIASPLDYFRNPQQLINLRAGGLGIYGGIAGGALALFLYTRRYRLPMIAWADLGVVGMALGQAIGRWGNFFNQELYGRPTNVPWAITIDPIYRLPGYTEFSRFHPAFLYESLWNFLAFVVLLTLARRYYQKLLTGDLMALYLIFYGIGRALLETVRLDSRTVGLDGVSLSIATLVSLVVAAVMGFWMAQRHLRVKRSEERGHGENGA